MKSCIDQLVRHFTLALQLIFDALKHAADYDLNYVGNYPVLFYLSLPKYSNPRIDKVILILCM